MCVYYVPAGLELYLWQHNMFICIPKEGIQLWVKVREGDIGLDALPHCGRIDVHITVGISLQKEAQWLRLITGEIDRVCLLAGPTVALQMYPSHPVCINITSYTVYITVSP